jgi:S1-C subfamily serine protease
MKKHNLYRFSAQALVVMLLMVALVGCSGLGGSAATPTAQAPDVAPTSQPLAQEPTTPVVGATATSSPALTGAFADAIRLVVEQAKPAVVQVTNEQAGIGSSGQSSTAVPVGTGSGIIYDTAGHILTNNHVVAGASSIIVSLIDGRTFTGKLLGGDARTDLAVIQISGSNLPVAQLGDSAQMRVGDWVVAIGNALALPGGPTVTAGVVSALDRSAQEQATSSGTAGPYLFGLIQTDAPINPGNSGGPLVNLDGQVIGINTLSADVSSGVTSTYGIGFAISIDTAKPIADQLVATGKVVHPYLGIEYVPLNPALSAQNGIPVPYGAYIQNVVAGSPAAQAGLQTGDVITAVDGTKIVTESGLAQMLSGDKPGDTVTLTVLRGNQTLTIKVTLGTLPS